MCLSDPLGAKNTLPFHGKAKWRAEWNGNQQRGMDCASSETITEYPKPWVWSLQKHSLRKDEELLLPLEGDTLECQKKKERKSDR